MWCVNQTAIVSPLPGREQAELTGQRLAALGLNYDVLIHSSMARATETANIISRHLPGSGQMPQQGSKSVSAVIPVCRSNIRKRKTTFD